MRLIRSFKFAFQGIKKVFKEEQNMRIHVFITVLVIIAGLVLKLSALEWSAIVICVGLVFSAEILNTAIENLVDFISPERHHLAGKIKDISAGAVVICAIVSVIVGCLIFLPKIGMILHHK